MFEEKKMRKGAFFKLGSAQRCHNLGYTGKMLIIKIPFINKGIDFIDLPSIFRDNTVESSLPDYFNKL